MARAGVLMCLLALKCIVVTSLDYEYLNDTMPSTPTARQLLEFKLNHPKPIGLHTVGAGAPVEVRDMISINSDLFRDEFFFDSQTHLDGEKTPERFVQAKGSGARGYFEVTNDVSKYTKADVFNGIGKKTRVIVRFSVGSPGRGGSDVKRDFKTMSTKFYTKEGNLDLLALHVPLFTFKEPISFSPFAHVVNLNPKTSLPDQTALWDLVVNRPDALTAYLYFLSDYGIPNGWRRMDGHPVHTFELNNKNGERWYARFHFRTLQGLSSLTTEEATLIQATDLNYYVRDLYDTIENGSYPSWRLEMDLLSIRDVQKVDYNPFDVTRLWKNGTYQTVTIGTLVLNRNPDNHFRDVEQAAYNPSNLVPGIPGPVDTLFRARRFAYRDTQNYRVGRNHLKIGVNAPIYEKSYKRDGVRPVWENGKDAPNYFPNSFNGPLPLVDEKRPKEHLIVLETNAVDLQEASDFYTLTLADEGAKLRLVENIVITLQMTTEPTRSKVLKLLSFTNTDLYNRVMIAFQPTQVVTAGTT